MSILDGLGALFSSDPPAAKQYTPYAVNKGDYDDLFQDAAVKKNNDALLNKFSNVSAPQAGQVQIDPNAGAKNAAGQQSLITQLQAQANGTGPSLASGMLKQGTDRTLANQAALAATMGASNPALAQRQLATNAITANQQLAQASAQQRMQDQINGQSQLGSVLNNARGQDIGLATAQAGLTQGTNLANLQAGTATNAQNLEGASNFNNAQLGYDKDVRDALQNYNTQQSTNTNQTNNLNEQSMEDYYKRKAAADNQKNAAIGGLISGVGQVGLGMMTGGGSTVGSSLLSSLMNSGAGADTGLASSAVPQGSSGSDPMRGIGYTGPSYAPPVDTTAEQNAYFTKLMQGQQ